MLGVDNRMEFKNWLQADESKKPENKNIVLVNDGSFNPVHRGHVEVTLAAKKYVESEGYNVVSLYMSPKHDEWLQKKFQNKPGEQIIPGEHRLAMVRQAVQGTGISVTDWEIRSGRYQGDPEYVRHFEQIHPGATFVMILGDDYGSCTPTPCFGQINGVWHVRLPRTGNLSSTRIRSAVRTGGEKIDDFLPAGVGDYMKQQNVLGDKKPTI